MDQPRPDASEPAEGRPPSGGTGFAGGAMAAIAAGGTLSLVAGLALPLRYGLASAATAMVAVVGLLWVMSPRAASLGAFEQRLRSQSKLIRFAVTAGVVVPLGVILAVAAQAIARITMDYPATIWVLPVALVGAMVVSRLRHSRGRALVVGAVALLVPATAVVGARCEAGSNDARGWAHSGPIHGIHPFQITAIRIDGYGPFDLPFNDYVEPDGSRGYDGPAFARALERALHRIAEVHYSDGPARARLAFANAEVEAVTTGPVAERLDRDAGLASPQRFIVRSGTYGQRSRVEFLCPGARDDPRGYRDDDVMNRSCPSKYAAEASAGLGVTGRWPGYAEGRGNERLSLARSVHATRSDDPAGIVVKRREQLAIAAVLLVGFGLWFGWRPRTGPPHGGPRGRGLWALAAALWPVVGALALVAWARHPIGPALGLFERPFGVAADERAFGAVVAMAMPALGVFGSAGVFAVVAGPCGRLENATLGRSRANWTPLLALPLGIGTLVAAMHLPAVAVLGPGLAWPAGGAGTVTQLVAALGEALGPTAGLSILQVEALAAGAVLLALLGVVTLAMGSLVRVGEAAGPVAAGGRRSALALAIAVGFAVALCVSRKTDGGSTLVAPAVALLALFASDLQLLGRARVGPGGAARRVSAILVHLVLVAVAAWFALGVALDPAAPHPFVVLCAAIGIMTATLACTLVSPRAGPA